MTRPREGVRSGVRRVLDRLCCPRCRAECGDSVASLAEESECLSCPRCGRRYPVRDGVPDLRPEPIGDAAGSLDTRAVEFYERVYEEEEYGREVQDEHVETLGRILAGIPEDGFVLELGTGLGALQDLHPAYVGTDLSIGALVRRIRGAAFASDAQQMPLRSGSVDAIYTIAVLEHVPRPDLAIEEIARVLRPGGVAYLAPAWNCRTWAAEGLHVRPYRDLRWSQKIRKAMIPIRDSLLWRGAFAIPKRMLRRAAWRIRSRPTPFRYRPLDANFEVFWASDSDATAQLDPHETALYFESRGWVLDEPPTVWRRVFHRADPVIVRRPSVRNPAP